MASEAHTPDNTMQWFSELAPESPTTITSTRVTKTPAETTTEEIDAIPTEEIDATPTELPRRQPPPLPPRSLQHLVQKCPLRVYLKIQKFVFASTETSRPKATELMPGHYEFPNFLQISRSTRRYFASTYYPTRAFIGSYENTKLFLQALTPEHRSLVRNLYVYIKPAPTPPNLRLQAKFKPKHRGSISSTTMKFGCPIPFKTDKVKLSPGVLCLGGREQIGFKADDWKEAEKERLKVHRELEVMVEKDRCVVRVQTYEQQLCAFIVGAEAVC
ncbi:hypothetical protein CBER1_00225 [Cercospora berteroae]|uniref:Uncharacterized protein n=1 Tax=Cercospora berteroae TaxID=357750 RepID=A0A2S6CD13_9PEZI|nr:hypothetical protein CBER1_00225 [Cercospora berteroae]